MDDIGNGKGYAPIGEKYLRVQFYVRGEHYTIVAAATPFGFIFERIYRDGVNDDTFIDFLDYLEPRLYPDNFGIIDNASIHKTVPSRVRLEQIFNGRYRFCAPYSPHLKPIEEMFKLVKEEISFIDSQNPLNYETPVELISAVFASYHIGGENSQKCFGCWNNYFAYHNNYLNNDLA